MNENQEGTNNYSTNGSKKSIISNLKVSCIEETSSGASTSPRNMKKEDLWTSATMRLELNKNQISGAITIHPNV